MKVRALYLGIASVEDYSINFNKLENEEYELTIEQEWLGYASEVSKLGGVSPKKSMIIKNPFLHPQFPAMAVNMALPLLKEQIDFAAIKIVEVDYPEKMYDFDRQGNLVEVLTETEKEAKAQMGGN